MRHGAGDVAGDGLAARRDLGSEAGRRAARLAADVLPANVLPPPPRLRYPRYGWRRAIRAAVDHRMVTAENVAMVRRATVHRALAAVRGERLEVHGMLFAGRHLELRARAGHGRLVIGPWCWLGDGTQLRSHEGQVTIGAKVVFGRYDVLNSYLDVEVGDAAILADHAYLCDFDHRTDRLDVPIKDQGIVTTPTRIGADVWLGERVTVLRGVTIGRGSVIAAHAVVNRDLPPFSIAAGVPARVVRSRLPPGMDPDEAAVRLERGEPLPGDPLER